MHHLCSLFNSKKLLANNHIWLNVLHSVPTISMICVIKYSTIQVSIQTIILHKRSQVSSTVDATEVFTC